MILVLRLVDGRNLALPERVVERVVDFGGIYPQAAGTRPVNHDIGFKTMLLVVRINVPQHRIVFERGDQLGRPLIEIRRAIGLQRVLIRGVGLPAACCVEVLDRNQIQLRTWHA